MNAVQDLEAAVAFLDIDLPDEVAVEVEAGEVASADERSLRVHFLTSFPVTPLLGAPVTLFTALEAFFNEIPDWRPAINGRSAQK